MKLSMVVPSYGQARYLGATLESLVSQRGLKPGELEIIVIDGGSKDGSVDILRQFSSKLDYWVSEPDRGQTHALHKGFARATGDVLGWLCSDDLLEPDAVRFVLDHFTLNPETRFFYGDALWIDSEGAVIRPKKEIPFNWFIWKYDHNYIPQPSAFWRKDLYIEAGGMDESLAVAMDSDLWIKFARRTRPEHVKRVLSRMREHPDAKSTKLHQQSVDVQRRICRAAGARVDNKLELTARYLAAKSLRVSWKFATGCYW